LSVVKPNTNHLKKLTTSNWEEAYRKDKHFRLYTPEYDGDRYTVYGDDLYKPEIELTIRWKHIADKEIDYYQERRFYELAQYLEKEGLID